MKNKLLYQEKMSRMNKWFTPVNTMVVGSAAGILIEYIRYTKGNPFYLGNGLFGGALLGASYYALVRFFDIWLGLF